MDHFIHGFLLSLSLCLDLGMVNLAIMRTGLQRGAQPAFMLGLGSCVGDLIYAMLSLVALSFLLSQPGVRWGLWIIGSAYLTYLTVKMLRESLSKSVDYSQGVVTTTGAMRHIAQGMGLALSSPTAALWFATVGGSVIASSADHSEALLLFFSCFFTCGVLWAGVMATLAGKRPANHGQPTDARPVVRFSAAIPVFRNQGVCGRLLRVRALILFAPPPADPIIHFRCVFLFDHGECKMKLGLMSAALPQLSLEQLAKWASANGFEMLELACWPVSKAERRYAGVTHIDVTTLTKAKANSIRSLMRKSGLEISSLGYYPNPLHPDANHRARVIEHLKKVIIAAQMIGVPVVGTFIGRDKDKTLEANFDTFADVWPPIVRFAADHGVKIAIENCPMIFSNDEWPGGDNLAISPSAWRRMFEIIPDANFGLNLDPSHLLWQMIDYERAVYDFRDRIFHVHAKDMEINREGLYQRGVLSLGMGWQIPRLPGLGEVNWPRFIAALYAVGYDYVLSIEHEDRAFEKTEELVKRGFYIARDALRPYLH